MKTSALTINVITLVSIPNILNKFYENLKKWSKMIVKCVSYVYLAITCTRLTADNDDYLLILCIDCFIPYCSFTRSIGIYMYYVQ